MECRSDVALLCHEERGWTRLHTGAIASFECVTQAIATSRGTPP
ncbi:hypothetical protein [Phormidium pseudopriestleyi]|nr:hypothetical protein [Phormidium pseudopriestleyi]